MVLEGGCQLNLLGWALGYAPTRRCEMSYEQVLPLQSATSLKTKKASERQVGGSHYKELPIQPGEYIRKNNIGWYEGNAIKYITRHKQKGGIEDIKKAIHYLELVLEEYDND